MLSEPEHRRGAAAEFALDTVPVTAQCNELARLKGDMAVSEGWVVGVGAAPEESSREAAGIEGVVECGLGAPEDAIEEGKEAHIGGEGNS